MDFDLVLNLFISICFKNVRLILVEKNSSWNMSSMKEVVKKFEKQFLNGLINVALVLYCSNFFLWRLFKVVCCSIVFVPCIDLHVFVLLHRFVLPLRLELKSKAQDLTQGKRSRFSWRSEKFMCFFSRKIWETLEKKSKILSESCFIFIISSQSENNFSEVSITNSVILVLAAVFELLLQTCDSFLLSHFVLMSHFMSYIFLPLMFLILLEGFCLFAQEGYQCLFDINAS